MPTNNKVIYSDIINNMTKNPITNDVGAVIDEQSVKDSLLGLLMTNRGERLYQPEVGGNIRKLLFDTVDNFTAYELKTEIEVTIANDEPRVVLEYLNVTPDPDRNQYAITVVFSIIDNLTTSVKLITVLKAE